MYKIENQPPVVYTDDQEALELAKQYADKDCLEGITLSVSHVYHQLCVDFVNMENWRDSPYRREDPVGFRLTAILADVYKNNFTHRDVILRPVLWW